MWVLLADGDAVPIDFDPDQRDEGRRPGVLQAVLHQHLEVHQPSAPLTQPNQLIKARALEGEPFAIEALVVRAAHRHADPITGRVAPPDAILHPTFLLGFAAGLTAHRLPPLLLADATLAATVVVAPKFLPEAVEATTENAAALGFGDALPSIQHEALRASAALQAGRRGAVRWGSLVVAGCGASGAAQRVVAVGWAGGSCGMKRG